ncbi:hypothetical protein C7B62_20440 [Pleurocapsa sp. CCALA 161]|jgi:hypothetical protein|uniref:hypothetical protein n=1 Tax=Pleurocapsa sp. CCALA 161 TaxID=2107688 RepID=UPI000D06FC55|nr:hypothetical protein [Pleurocapsa sp. CCALA 161]PSB07285.1 hypothetical protein C7B62_20440 [Pleurocapsa sp. CCALA 161]
MANQTSKSNKSETIFYRLNFKSSSYSQALIEYLQEQRHCLSGRQKVEQIVETFLLPLVVSPEDPNFKAIVVESLSKLKSQIDIIQVLTGISLFNNYQSGCLQLPNSTAQTSTLKASQFTNVEQQQDEPQINTKLEELTPFQELEATIDSFKQQLKEGIDPLVISQKLAQIQPEEEESWSEQMWQTYDSFYEEVSQLEYQATFSPETGA